MFAAVKTDNPKEIAVKEEQTPVLREGEVLIKVNHCGVCGSDLHAFTHSKGYEFVKKPIILGHELSGEVVDSFSKSDKTWLGKRVIVESMQYCNECENCQAGRYSICESNKVIGLHFNGGMAQYVKTKSTFIREVPNNLSLGIAALSEPMAIAVHAVKKAGELTKDQTVLVQGPGIIGFFVGLISLEKGAKVILSGLEKDYSTRLARGKEFGMNVHIADRERLTGKVDIIFECSGAPAAVQGGFNYLKKGGKTVIVALYEQSVNLFLTNLVRNEWPIITSYGCDPVDYDEAFKVLISNERKLRTIATEYPLSEVAQAFEDSLNKDVLKAILTISE